VIGGGQIPIVSPMIRIINRLGGDSGTQIATDYSTI
jgi:hypothetical protein